MTNEKNLMFLSRDIPTPLAGLECYVPATIRILLSAILFLSIGAADSGAQESFLNEEETNQVNQKIIFLVDEFGDSQYAKREKAAEKFAVWFVNAATAPATKEIIKQELSEIAQDEDFELEIRHRSAATLKVLRHIERGEEYGIKINSRELSNGETIIVENLGSYCRLIDNCERLINEPSSADLDLDNVAENGWRTFPFLLKILEENPSHRLSSPCAAIKILGRIGGRASIEALVKILKDDEKCLSFRSEATKALAEISLRQEEGNKNAIDELTAILKIRGDYRTISIRMDIMELFKKIGGEKAITILASVLCQNDEQEVSIRILAAIYLGQIGDSRATDALTQAALLDPYEYVRFWAQDALIKIREKEKAQKELTF